MEIVTAIFVALEDRRKIEHFEVTPTHVRVYLAGFSGQEKRYFSYRLRPFWVGDFSFPPVRAYLFYTPYPRTEIDGLDIQIRSEE